VAETAELRPIVRAPFGRIAVLLTALATLARADSTPVATVESFVRLVTGGDVAKAALLRTEETRGAFREEVQRRRGRCARVAEIVTRATETGNTAVVATTVTRSEWSAAPDSFERLATRRATFHLVRRDGTWQIANQIDDDAAEADAILAGRDTADAGPAVGEALCRRALTFINQINMAKGKAAVAMARRIAEDSADSRLLALVLGIESIIVRVSASPDVPRSIALATAAVAEAERSGDTDVLAESLLRLIRAVRNGNGMLDVEKLVERALALEPYIDDPTPLAHVATQAAESNDSRKRHAAAFRYALLAERLANESGSIAARISAEMNVAGSYGLRRDGQLAVLHYERALILSRKAGFHATTLAILEQIASLTRAITAARFVELTEALDHLPDDMDLGYIALSVLLRRATARAETGELAGARQDVARARTIADTDEEKVHIRLAEGRILMFEGKPEAAIEAWQDIEWIPEWRAQMFRAAGRFAEAERELRRAIEGAEIDEHRLPTDLRQRWHCNGSIADPTRELVSLLAECGRTGEALALLSRFKGRILDKVVGDPGAWIEQRLDSAARVHYEALDRKLTALKNERAVADPPRMRAIDAETAAVRIELDELSARLFNGKDANTVRDSVTDVVPVVVPRGVIGVEFAVLPDVTVVLTVTPPASRVRAYTLPYGRDAIRERVRKLTTAIERGDLRAHDLTRAMYDLLLRPIEQDLFRTGHTICVVPDDELWLVPFHALRDGRGRYVIERSAVFYAPSLRMATDVVRPRTTSANRLLAFANARWGTGTESKRELLAEAVAEVNAIAEIYGTNRSRVYSGPEATREVFGREAPHYRILHIAAHGIVEPDAPMYSAFALSAPASSPADDGMLEAREIASMPLDADLAVLSACSTASGRISPGEGPLGMCWAFLAAGCRAVVASQWDAESTTTADLMVAFHRRLAAGDPPPTALRAAQRGLLQRDPSLHPLYWAPFVVVGAGAAR
jgi:CHAT domain-containing protein